jgi:hypothetical protein
MLELTEGTYGVELHKIFVYFLQRSQAGQSLPHQKYGCEDRGLWPRHPSRTREEGVSTVLCDTSATVYKNKTTPSRRVSKTLACRYLCIMVPPACHLHQSR